MYAPPKVDPRDCDHPDNRLKYHDGFGLPGVRYYWRPKGSKPQSQPSMFCMKCNSVVIYVNDESDFIKQREFKYTSETGQPVVPRDMLGNEIKIGSVIVYPRPRHTMGTGVVEAIDHTNTVSDWDKAQRPRVDAPVRIKVQQMEWDSKDFVPYMNRRADGTPKSITLVQGACSAVVVG